MSRRGRREGPSVGVGGVVVWVVGVVVSISSEEKQSQCAEGHRGRWLRVESLCFHRLAEHRHGEDQAQDLHQHGGDESRR